MGGGFLLPPRWNFRPQFSPSEVPASRRRVGLADGQVVLLACNAEHVYNGSWRLPKHFLHQDCAWRNVGDRSHCSSLVYSPFRDPHSPSSKTQSFHPSCGIIAAAYSNMIMALLQNKRTHVAFRLKMCPCLHSQPTQTYLYFTHHGECVSLVSLSLSLFACACACACASACVRMSQRVVPIRTSFASSLLSNCVFGTLGSHGSRARRSTGGDAKCSV